MTGTDAPDGGRVSAAPLEELPGAPPQARDALARQAVRAHAAELVDAAIGQWVHAAAAEQREAALSLIAALPDSPGRVRHLRVLLQDPLPAVRRAAAALLCRGTGDPGSRRLLLGLVRDEDPAVRRPVIAALARDPGADVVEPFLQQLGLEGEAEQALMTGALLRLAGDPGSRLAERLMPALADEDDRVREAAVHLLGRMPDAAQTLRSFLIHSRGLASWLRERAAASIMRISCDIVEPLARLMQDAEQDVRAGALQLAWGCRDPRIVPPAIAIFLGTDAWWVRSLAAETLGNFPCPEVRRALLSRLEDPELRLSVISVLGKMSSCETSGPVVRCLSDADRGTRMAALEALAAVEGPEVFAAVQKIASGDPDPALRDKALVILERHRPATERHLRELAAAGVGAGRPAGAAGPPALATGNESPPAGR